MLRVLLSFSSSPEPKRKPSTPAMHLKKKGDTAVDDVSVAVMLLPLPHYCLWRSTRRAARCL